MAREQQRRARLAALCGQQVEEALPRPFVEGGGRLVGDDELRRSDERPRDGDALLLADAELGDRPREPLLPVQSETGEQAARLRFGRSRPRPGALAPTAREPARQGDVVDHRQVGHQVEHLEDEADVVGAEAVAAPRRHRRELGPEDPDRPLPRARHPAEQSEQGALAAAARPFDEHPLPGRDLEARDVEHVAFAVLPGEPDPVDLDGAGPPGGRILHRGGGRRRIRGRRPVRPHVAASSAMAAAGAVRSGSTIRA